MSKTLSLLIGQNIYPTLLIICIFLSIISSSPCGRNYTDISANIEPVPILVFVVGKVNDTSARLLIEVNKSDIGISQLADAPIVCLQTAMGEIVIGMGNRTRLMAGRPTIFQFHDLYPETEYAIKFDGITLSSGTASFQTYPAGGFNLTKNMPNIAAVSCNSIYMPQNHWKNLAKFVGLSVPKSDRLSLLIHMGDQVYLDWWCKDGGGDVNSNCLWDQARNLLSGKNIETERLKNWSAIEDLFRNVYHKTWSNPSTAKILANVPNLAIFDDHDFKDEWGNFLFDFDGVDWFIGKIAYYLVLEYQVQLHKDIQWNLPLEDLFKNIIPYHAHAFGDVGVLFSDSRNVRNHYNFREEAFSFESPLGTTQRKWIKKMLHPNDKFKSVKVMIFITSMPLVYFPNCADSLGIEINENKAHWVRYPKEQQRILDLLDNWKLANFSREVVILAGDLHRGGFTKLYKNGDMKFIQVTASPIANELPPHANEVAQKMETFRNSFSLKNGWSFEHTHSWTGKRNFGLLHFKKTNARPIVQIQLHLENEAIIDINTYSNTPITLSKKATVWISILSTVFLIVILIVCKRSLCCKKRFKSYTYIDNKNVR